MPNFLVTDIRTGSGGQCVAYTYNNGSPSQLGDAFGTILGGSFNYCKLRDGIIQFQGQIYAVAQDGIYQKDDPTTQTGTWTQVLAFTSPSATVQNWSGIHVATIGGTPTLFGVYGETSALFRWFKFDGTTWTQSVSGTDPGIADGNSFGDVVVWNNVLYGLLENTRDTVIFDPGSNSFSSGNAVVDNGSNCGSLCVFGGRLFLLDRGDVTNSWELFELLGTAWTSVSNTSLTNFGVSQLGKSALFTDGTYLYGMVPRSAAASQQGWYCMRWDADLILIDITTEVLPSTLISADSGGTYAGGANIINEAMLAVYDLNTDPTSTQIYLYYSSSLTAGSSMTMYQWNYDPITNPPPDPANEITIVDTGGDVFHSLPTGYPNYGERIWTAGELDIKITGIQGVTGGEEISFIAYGGGTGRIMKLYYARNTEPVLQEATLRLPVTGGSATFNGGSNQVEGIAADGTTVYTIVWDTSTDSLSQGDRAIRVPQINTV